MSRPHTPILEQPPLIAIENLSPEDRPAAGRRTIAVSLQFGVAYVRVIAPETLEILESRRKAFEKRRDFLVPALRDLGFRVPVMPTGGFFAERKLKRAAEDAVIASRARNEGIVNA